MPFFADTDEKLEKCLNKKTAASRRRRRNVAEKSPLSETSDDDGFSSTNTTKSRRSRSKSTEVTKKGPRGRPRKNPIVQPSPSPVSVAAVMSPPPKITTPKKETVKKQTAAARARNARLNSNVKSRAIVSTDSSSDDDESSPAKAKSCSTPNNNNARLPIVSPRQQSLVAAANQNYLSSPTSRSPALRGNTSVHVVTNNLRNNSISPATGRISSSHSKLSSASSDGDDDNKDDNSDSSSSTEDSDKSIKDNKKVNKVKSDKNKSDTLRKLFYKGEGGAKGKGQVLIVDHSEDIQQQHHQHTQSKENSIPNEKLLSPYAYNNNSKHASNNNNNVLVNGTSASELSPLKPSNTSNTSLGLSKAQSTLTHSLQPIICKIDLGRLSRVPSSERTNRVNRVKSPLNMESIGRRNSMQFQKRDDDRSLTGRSPIDFGHNGNGRRSRNCNVDDEINSRLSNSRDSSSSSTTTSSKHRDGENGNNCRSNSRFDMHDTSTVPIVTINERNKHHNSSNSSTTSGNGSCNTVIHNMVENRLGHVDQHTLRNLNSLHSPKLDEKPISKIKRESLKNEFSNNEYNNAYGNSPKTNDDKNHTNFSSKINYGNDNNNSNIKRENIKMESTYSDNNVPEDTNKLVNADDFASNNRKKRSSSANSSPYKDKKRKKLSVETIEQQILPPTNHDRLDAALLPPPPQKPLSKVYVSYFERTNDERDEIR